MTSSEAAYVAPSGRLSLRDRMLLAVAGWVMNRCSQVVRESLVDHIRKYRPVEVLAYNVVKPLDPKEDR